MRWVVRMSGILVVASPACAGGMLPSGGHFVAGQGAISGAGNGLTINQSSSHGIIKWQSFSIGAGNTVQFNNGSGATLNRVVGNNLSEIDGQLSATGSVYLINPQGIIIGPGGKVVTNGSFVASTRDVSNSAFMSGSALNAAGTSNGDVVNAGTITSKTGDAILVGRSVSNSGTVSAPNGTAGMAAGNQILLQPAGSDPRIAVSGGTGDVTNTGTVKAAQAELNSAGGNVYALAGNNGGLISATGTKTVDGHVWLTAGGATTVSGTISAANANGTGGTIVAAGGNVTLRSSAKLDASGTSGGTVLVGGDHQGGSNPATKFVRENVASAQTTTVQNGATIKADGSAGKGGSVVVWSDGTTEIAGAISATGAGSGLGGFIETSGHAISLAPSVSILAGDGGNWLLDPAGLTINSTLATTIEGALNGGSDVTETSGSDILVSSPVTWTSAKTLTLSATTNITINAAVTGASGGLTLIAGTGSDSGTPTPGAITATGAVNVGTFTLTLGNWSQSSATLPGFAATNFTYDSVNASTAGTSFLRVTGGSGTSGSPYQIADVYGLVGIGTSTTLLADYYKLVNNIDASTLADFISIGQDTSPDNFSGTLDGQNYTIDHLTSTGAYNNMAGLFGWNFTGTVKNLKLTNVTIGGTNAIDAGSVVAQMGATSSGTVTNVFVVGGSVSGTTDVGGLVGRNSSGTISGSSATGVAVSQSNTHMSGVRDAGGLVGQNNGTITQSYATGSVSANKDAGGLAGYNTGTISQSYATGAVTLATLSASAGTGSFGAGGFVGVNVPSGTGAGTITQSYSMGSVTVTNANSATAYVGSFVGANGGPINEAYATGYVSLTSGSGTIGGFAGADTAVNSAAQTKTGSETNTYFDSGTTGQSGGSATSALQGTLPSGFNTVSAGVWSTGSGLYPYFSWQYSSTPQAISGTAYSDSGVTALKGGAITAFAGGTGLGTVSTGANGYYYLLAPSGTLSGGGSAALAYVSGGGTGARAYTLTGTTSGFDLWGGTLIAPTADTTYSTASATTLQTQDATLISTADGGNSAAATALTALTHYGYIANGSGFTVDQALTMTGGYGLYIKTLAGDITIADSISLASGALSLDAYHGIVIDAPVTISGGGAATLTTNDGGSGGSVSFGLLALGSTGKLSFTGTEGAGQSLTINGTSYDLIYTAAELQAINASTSSLTQTQPYAIANSIDLSSISNFTSIGSSAQAFTGTLDGLNNTVSGLVQTDPTGYGGLFGLTKAATLRNINLANISITVTGNSTIPTYVGGLVANANNNGSGVGTTLSNVAVSGTISLDNKDSQILAGGVIGLLEQYGSGADLAANVAVSDTATDVAASQRLGGLVGANDATISRSIASGAVAGSVYVGGFAGLNSGTITQSYATGAVTLNNPSATAGASNTINGSLTLFAGGFVGVNGNASTGFPGTITQSYATGSVTVNAGSSRPGQLIITSAGGGFAGINTKRYAGDSLNSGTLNEVYATGYVSGGTSTGGLVGMNSSAVSGAVNGTITNSYWDIETTGQTTVSGDSGASTSGGMTTAALQGTLPAGFNTVASGVWSTATGRFPYFGWRYSTTPDVVSGIAYSDRASTVLAGVAVNVLASGSNIGTASTGANGYYYLAAANGTLPSSGALAVLTGSTKGNAFTDTGSSGLISGLDIYGGYLRLASAGATYSGIVSDLSTALGSNTGSDYLFTVGAGPSLALDTNTSLEIDSARSGTLTIDQSITTSGTGNIVLNDTTGGTIDASGDALSTSTLALLGSGATYTLTNAGNDVAKLAASTGTINLNNGANNLAIGSFASMAGVSATSLTLTDTGTVTQTSQTTGTSLNVTDLTLLGSGGTYTLTASGNSVGKVAANTGAVSLTDSSALTVGTVNATAGITSSGVVTLLATGDLTIASGAKIASGTGDNIVISATGAFVNNESSDAVAAGTGGRWLIYSADPTGDTFGSLDSTNTAIWDATYATLAPGSVTATGNRYLFGNQPTLTFTSTNTSKTYGTDGTSVIASAYSVSGYDPGVTNVYLADSSASTFSGAPALTSTGTATTATVAGGPYAIDIAQGTLSALNGYAFAFQSNGKLTVNQAAVTLTYSVADATSTYGTLATLGNVTLTGVSNSDIGNVSGALSLFNGNNSSVTLSAMLNAGIYAEKVTSLTGSAAGNYTIATSGNTNGTLTINPKALTASLTGAVSKIYNGTTAATLSAGNYSLSGVVSGDAVALNDPTTGSYDTKNAGTGKTVSVSGLALSGASSGNYTLSSTSTSGAIGAITQATLTASLTGTVSKIYDGTTAATLSDANYSLSGAINGDTVALNDPTSGTYDNANAGTGKLVTVSGLAISGADSGNYMLAATSISGGIGTITPAPLTTSVTYSVADATGTYGTLATLGAVTLTGVLSKDAADVSDVLSLFDSGNNPAAHSATMSVGKYTEEVTSLTGSAAGNYTIATTGNTDGTLTINPKTLTISLTGTVEKTYDGTVAATLDAANYGLSGVISGDSVSLNDPTSGAYDNANAGTGKTISVSGLSLSGAGANNYTLASTSVSGAVGTIDTRPLTVAADSLSRLYGNANPSLTYTVGGDGLVNGDTLSGSLATDATTTSNVGSYGITQGTLAASSNYSLSYTAGTLSVAARPLTVTADSLSRLYGNANPSPTYTVGGDGLVNGDTLSGSLATDATTTSNVGSYGITQGTLAASSNYSLSYVGGTLTVSPAPLSITANDVIAVSLSSAQFTASYSGFVNGQDNSVVTGLQYGLFPVTGNSLNYDIAPFGATAPNYAIGYFPGLLTIDQPTAPLVSNHVYSNFVVTSNFGTAVFSNVATSAIGDSGKVMLFQAGLPGRVSSFFQIIISDYSNATSADDRLVTTQ